MHVKSRIAAMVVVVPVVVAFASPASADTAQWSPWKNVTVIKPVHYNGCGGARMEERDYIQHEKIRTRNLGHGNTAIELYGRYEVKVIDHTHHKYAIVNASGSSVGKNYSIAYANGNYLFRSTGASLTFQRRTHPVAPGFPRDFVAQGRISILFYGDQSKTPKVFDRPAVVRNVCSLLK